MNCSKNRAISCCLLSRHHRLSKAQEPKVMATGFVGSPGIDGLLISTDQNVSEQTYLPVFEWAADIISSSVVVLTNLFDPRLARDSFMTTLYFILIGQGINLIYFNSGWETDCVDAVLRSDDMCNKFNIKYCFMFHVPFSHIILLRYFGSIMH